TDSGEAITRDIKAQLELVLKARDSLAAVSQQVRVLRAVRKQLEDRNALLKDNKAAVGLVEKSKTLIEKLDEIEEKFHNPKAEATYDILAQKGGARLYSQFGLIYEE